jgi:hypothetical protein
MLGLVPNTLIARLFLAPDETARGGITLKGLLQLLLRKRIKLLDTQDRNITAFERLTPLARS